MKKLLSLIVATSLVFSLAACGGGADNKETQAQTQAPEETQAAGDTTAAGTEAQTQAAGSETSAPVAASGEGTFKIGGIGPTTGGAAQYGLAVKQAIELAVKEINANGGINGYQVEFNFQDDEHDAEKSVNAYNTLKDWGMQLLIGTVTSNPCLAVAEETHNDNLFMLTPSGSAVKCVQYDNAFRVCFSDPDQGAASAQYIGEHKIATKVAVIYDSSDVYSSGIYEKFAAEAANQGLEIVSAEAFTSDNKTDFSVQIQKAKDGGAELVFLPIYYNEAALILSQAAGMDFKPMFFGCDGLDGILTVENFDTALAEEVMLLTPFAADAQDDMTVKFVADYQAAYNNEIPSQFAADGYDCVYVLKAALEQANATPDMDASALCDLLKEAMVQVTVDGLTGEGMTWNAEGEPSKAPKAVKIVNGVYTAME